MTSFVLIPGAGGSAWYWHRVVPLLRGRRVGGALAWAGPMACLVLTETALRATSPRRGSG